MSRWSTAFQELLSSWEKLKSRLQEEDLGKQVDSASAPELARIRKVAEYVESVLEQIDPELVTTQFVASINAALANAQSELNAFAGNANIGHLQNVNNHFDVVISAISQTPFVLSAAQKGSLTRAATAYSETIEELIEKLSSRVDESLSGIAAAMSQFKDDIESSKNELVGLKNEIKSSSANIESHLSQFSSQFQSSETSRNERFDAVVTKYSEKADAEFQSLATKAGTILGVLSKFQDDAQSVLGAVVNTAQAGAYASYANEEKKSANSYRRGALLLMVLGVIVLVAPEFYKIAAEQATYSLDWHRVLARLPFSLVLFVPAFYLARESSQHRTNEVLNRRRQLILTTIHPYLELIDPSKAEQIRADVARGIFSEGTALVEPAEPNASNLIAQLSNLVKLLARK